MNHEEHGAAKPQPKYQILFYHHRERRERRGLFSGIFSALSAVIKNSEWKLSAVSYQPENAPRPAVFLLKTDGR